MTTDGGTHWRFLSLPVSLRKSLALTTGLVGATFLSPSDFWATADRYVGLNRFPRMFLFHTTDTGLSATGTALAPVLWLSGASNVVPCLERSADGGSRWTGGGPVDPSIGQGGEVWSALAFSGSRGALVDSYGSVTAFYSTSNGGNTWAEHRPPRPTNGPMDVVSPTTWFAVVGKVLYLTTDGGVIRTGIHPTKDLSGQSGTGSLDFVNAMDGWTVLRSGRLWHTTDGGRLWKLELLPR
jgi:hypothetical protein